MDHRNKIFALKNDANNTGKVGVISNLAKGEKESDFYYSSAKGEKASFV